MKTRLNGSEMVREIRRLAKTSPSRRALATYVVRDVPHCIVGTALVETGSATVDELQGIDQNFRMNVHAGTFSVSPRYANWICKVQQAQDQRRTWTQAVAEADTKYGAIR